MYSGRYGAKRREELGIENPSLNLFGGRSGLNPAERRAARRSQPMPERTPERPERPTGIPSMGENYAAKELMYGNKVRELRGEEPYIPARNQNAPRDPNNTGATGTITGLSGGSLSGAFDSDKYLSKFMQDAGIEVQNPFDSSPVAGSYESLAQMSLKPGMIEAAGVSFTGGIPKLTGFSTQREIGDNLYNKFSEFRAPIDMESFANQELVSGMEAAQAPIGSGAELGENKLSGLSARSRAFLDYDGPGGAMGALRAADASQGMVRAGGKMYSMDQAGDLQEVTKEGARMRASGQIDAQTLLDDYLANVPEKAIEKVIETGDPEVLDPTKAGTTPLGNFEQLSNVSNAGNEMSAAKLYNTTAPEGGGPGFDMMDEISRVVEPYRRRR